MVYGNIKTNAIRFLGKNLTQSQFSFFNSSLFEQIMIFCLFDILSDERQTITHTHIQIWSRMVCIMYLNENSKRHKNGYHNIQWCWMLNLKTEWHWHKTFWTPISYASCQFLNFILPVTHSIPQSSFNIHIWNLYTDFPSKCVFPEQNVRWLSLCRTLRLGTSE